MISVVLTRSSTVSRISSSFSSWRIWRIWSSLGRSRSYWYSI